MTPPATRHVRAAAWLGWPTGLVLALAHAAGALPTPAFGVLAAAYLAGVGRQRADLRGGVGSAGAGPAGADGRPL